MTRRRIKPVAYPVAYAGGQTAARAWYARTGDHSRQSAGRSSLGYVDGWNAAMTELEQAAGLTPAGTLTPIAQALGF